MSSNIYLRNGKPLPYIEEAYQKGLHLEINIQFYDEGDGTMSVLSATVTSGAYDSCDYGSIINQTTITDLVKEYLGLK